MSIKSYIASANIITSGGIIKKGDYVPNNYSEKKIKILLEQGFVRVNEIPSFADKKISEVDGISFPEACYTEQELNAMKKEALIDYADSLGIEDSDKLNKADIINMILNFIEEQDDVDEL